MKTQFLIAVGAIAIVLNACVPYPDSGGGGNYRMPIPVPAGGGGGGGSSAPRAIPPMGNSGDLPSQPLYAEQPPQEPEGDYYNIPGQREVHGATSTQACRNMERNFLQQGIRLKLTKTVRNPNPGNTLPTLCVFEGEDAIEGRFADSRYNSSDEYAY